MNDFDAWDARTRDLLEQAYVEAGDGPRGSGSGQASLGDWRAKRQQLAVPMDRDGTWLDVGCANGFLMATLPSWCAERDVTIEPYGPELLPKVADLARALHPTLAERIWTGSVMQWSPPQLFTYVTTLEDQVPPDRLGDLVGRLLDTFVEAGGRLIVSAYTNADNVPRDLFGRSVEAVALAHPSGCSRTTRCMSSVSITLAYVPATSLVPPSRARLV